MISRSFKKSQDVLSEPQVASFDERQSSLSKIDRILSGRWYRWIFPASIEAHFFDDTKQRRGKLTRGWLLLNAVLMAASAVVYGFMGMVSPLSTPLYLMICLAFTCGFVLTEFRSSYAVHNIALTVLNFSFVITLTLLGQLAPETMEPRYFMAAAFFVLMQNLSLWLHPWHVFGLTLAQVAVFAAILIGVHGLYPLGQKLDYLFFVPCAMLFSLFTFTQMDQERRKAWFFGQCDRRRMLELAIVNEELRNLSNTDPLTGVANRRSFNLLLDESWVKAALHAEPISIMMLDVDHFKKFNDFFGHAAGDDCLRAIAQTIEKNVRSDFDLLARYGGEEFIAILPSADAEMAYEIGERVRTAIERMVFREDWHLTASIGVAVSKFGPALDTAEALVARADKALYQAKSEGRNKTVLCPDPGDSEAIEVCTLEFSSFTKTLPEQKVS